MHLKSLFRSIFCIQRPNIPSFFRLCISSLETIWLNEPRDLIFLGPLMTLLCLSRYSSMQQTHLATFWCNFRISLIERIFHHSKDTKVFGLIRYKSDDFSENSNTNSEMCVVLLLFLLYHSCRTVVSLVNISYMSCSN